MKIAKITETAGELKIESIPKKVPSIRSPNRSAYSSIMVPFMGNLSSNQKLPAILAITKEIIETISESCKKAMKLATIVIIMIVINRVLTPNLLIRYLLPRLKRIIGGKTIPEIMVNEDLSALKRYWNKNSETILDLE